MPERAAFSYDSYRRKHLFTVGSVLAKRPLKQRGIGVLITDHNVRETLGICDRAYIINAGSVMAEGKPEEIIYNEGVRKVYLGEHFKL